MKKRKNIIISAITCLFSICLMMFGVYAATNPSVSINGQVSYTARDASILVQGKMYGADGYETGEYRTVADPTSPQPSDVLTDSVSQYVDYTSADQNKSTMATWELGDGLHFYEDSNGVCDVTLSFKFTNLSKYPVVAKVKSVNVTENNNITLVPPEKTEIYLQQNTSANNTGEMTFAVKVADDSKDAKITFSLVLEFTKLEMTTQGWSVDWYNENQDALRIVGFEGTDAQAVNIPATLSKDGKSYPVKAIGWGIDSVDSVTGAENGVFAPNLSTKGELNTNLRTAFVSEGIQEIDALSFIACSSLTDVTIPDSVTKIGLGAFANCPLLAYIQIPSSCTKIGQVAFSSAGLKEITLPSTLQSIGAEAFDECTNLKKVIIEQEDCTKLPCEASIFGTLSNDSTLQIFVKSKDYKTATNWSAYKDYMIVGAFSLDDWTVQIDKPTKTLNIIKYNGDSSVSRLIIPASFQIDGVTYKTVAIGGTSPVNNPQDLNDLQEQLGDDSPVFVNSAENADGFNTSIKNIVIEDGIQIIGNYAFSGLMGLESISIPKSVTKMGACSFFFCWNLTNFDFPQNLTEIGYCAFAFSGNVENIEIPAKVTKVDFGLSGFKNITFAHGSQLTTIPNGCFAEALVETIELPESLTSIGDEAFAQTSVKKIVINSENVTLGNDVFKDYIGDTGIGNDLSNLKLYVPNESYKTATNWSKYVDNIIVGR